MEDRLTSFHERLTEFMHQKLNLVLAIVGIFVFFALIFTGIKYYTYSKEKKASELLISALEQKEPLKALKVLIKKYPSTRAGLEASLILFDRAYENEDFNSAQKYLKIFKSHAPSYFHPLINYGEGKIQEEKKAFTKAIDIYEENVKKIRPLDLYLYLDLGRLSKETGNLAAAKRYYQAVLSEFPESEFSPLVKYELWTLK